MPVTSAHRVLGIALAGAFLLISLWGLVSWIRNRDPGPNFWRLLAAGQGGLALQAAVGAILFFVRGQMPVLHYIYGGFPILVLIFAHKMSKRLEGLEWAAFAVAGFFIFGLQLRGMMTGWER